jgi:hypothetical protein
VKKFLLIPVLFLSLNSSAYNKNLTHITCSTICQAARPFALIGGIASIIAFFRKGGFELGIAGVALLTTAGALSDAEIHCNRQISYEMKGVRETFQSVASLIAWGTIGIVALRCGLKNKN